MLIYILEHFKGLEEEGTKQRRGRGEGMTKQDMLELRCLLQKMKLQKIIGLAEKIPNQGTVEEYLADVVSLVEEPEPQQASQETKALKATLADLKADNIRLQEENSTLRVLLKQGTEDQLLRMREFYYGAEEGEQDGRTEIQKLKEQVKDLTKRLLDAENMYFGCQDDFEKMKCELKRRDVKLRQAEARISGYRNNSLLGMYNGGIGNGDGGGLYSSYSGYNSYGGYSGYSLDFLINQAAIGFYRRY